MLELDYQVFVKWFNVSDKINPYRKIIFMYKNVSKINKILYIYGKRNSSHLLIKLN